MRPITFASRKQPNGAKETHIWGVGALYEPKRLTYVAESDRDGEGVICITRRDSDVSMSIFEH